MVVDRSSLAYLRVRARYWRSRADQEEDPVKQARFRETAMFLEREAVALEDMMCCSLRWVILGSRPRSVRDLSAGNPLEIFKS